MLRTRRHAIEKGLGDIAAPDGQVVCSSITFRHRSLEEALQLKGVIFRKVLGGSLGLLFAMCVISLVESLPSVSRWIVP